MGGDEFALLLPITSSSHCKIVVSKIQKVMREPFLLDGMPLEIGASLGIATYPEHARDAGSLIRCAEVAMYIAKDNGEPYSYYDPERDPHSLKRLKISSDLRLAAEKKQFSLYYQPKMAMESRQIIGVEALIRWIHPEYGFISPDEFIPLAEQSGAIKPLTEWVLDTAIKQCVKWNEQGIPLTVSVNLSARSLHDTELPEQIDAMLKTYGLPASQLELEITETAIMMDPDRASEILNRLHSAGMKLSIDDFGTGYTSLSYLKQLPVDDIKIDKSFVMNMIEDHDNAVIVQSIISLAHSMGRGVIAEGVESKAIIDELSKLGCDTIQGYFLSRPAPPSDFEEWLQGDAVSSEPDLKYQAI
jgi:EAL domain-containing protein (putative c-di-GMP-specific phosphodiesterase class I)